MEEREERQLSKEEIELTFKAYEDSIALGKAISELSRNKNFKLLQKAFVEDFAINQLNNAHNYNDKGNEKFLINYKARAIFKNFIDESIGQGINSAEEIKEFKEALKTEGYEY